MDDFGMTVEEWVEILREECKDMTPEEIWADASNNHIWALGSDDDDEAAEFETISDALKILAKEKEKERGIANVKKKN